MQDLILNPVLNGNSETVHFSHSDNKEAYKITTKASTLAVRIQSFLEKVAEEDTEINSLLQVDFIRKTPEGSFNIPAVDCKDFFADEIDSNEAFFEDVFYGEEQWVCPDTSQLDLLNQDYSIEASIVSCEYA